ncbi:MAG TPA: TIGR01212 family radical SAM protein [bacterium]|nr:TIGR01212 family radical SAM protein [bacterium]HQO34042.1 TIGR01212 family radical SAM protein [bacterium]HQP97964.1 TIGR01212 family radical SAM protein [bacterium]
MHKRYRTFGDWIRERYGCRVHKVCVDAGFTCPNRDGSKAAGGCTFCNNEGFSYNTRRGTRSVREQVQEGMEFMRRRYKAERFIAYFQPYSNTYGPIEVLRSRYEESLSFPEMVALSVGTRPDCVSPSVLDLLEGYAQQWDVWIEYGLQTVHNRTLERVNRCDTYENFVRIMEQTIPRPINICIHVILGLPGESREDMLETAQRIAEFPYHSLKIHLMHVMRDTVLADQYRRGEVSVLTREEYAERVADFLEYVPADVALQRLSADAPREVLVAPEWCLDRTETVRAIEDTLERRDTWQGKKLGFPPPWEVALDHLELSGIVR